MIDQDRLIQTFCALVQIDSPSGHETQISAAVAARLQRLGIDTTTDHHGNVIGRLPGTGTPLLLNAHLDTVEPGRGVEPVVADGIIRSHGNTILGADNKVAAAALLEAAETLLASGQPHGPLELVFTTSEEVANLGAVGLDTDQLQARYGFTFDSGDPLGTITVASPFYNRFDITLLGQAAHASRPEQARNVLPALQQALATIPIGRVSDTAVCNIGVIEAGSARNTVPGTVVIRGEVRSFVQTELDSISAQIVATFETAAQKHGVRCNADVVLENAGYLFADDDPFVRFTSGVVQSAGLTPVCKQSSECYDANIFNDRGIRTLNIANNVQGMHTVDESIAVADLVTCTEIVLALITQWATFNQKA